MKTITKFLKEYKAEVLLFAGIIVFFWLVSMGVKSCQSEPYPGDVKQITKRVEQEVKPADTRLNALYKDKKVLEEKNKTLEQKLYAAQLENKRLRNSSKSSGLNENNFTPTISEMETVSDCTEISNAAAASDSLCNEVINNLHAEIITQDSISFYKDIKISVLNKGLDDAVNNSLQKDEVIKSINKKLKRQNVQNVGLKAVLIGAAVVIIKNNL